MIKGEGGALDRGKKSEASLESVGAKASRAAGGFGSSASGVGTLSDICLLTAAGAAGWIDVGWGGVRWAGGGGGGGWRAGAFSYKPASAPTSYSGKTTTTQYHSSSSARSEQADSVSQHEWVIEVICRGGNGKCQQIHSWFEVAST